LNVLDFIFGLLQVDDLDCNNLLSSIVDSFEDFTEGTFSNSLLFGEDELWVLRAEKNETDDKMEWTSPIGRQLTSLQAIARQ